MNGDDADREMLVKLLDAGVPFYDAWMGVIRAAWRGKDEPMREIIAHPGDGPQSVSFVCGASFQFGRAGVGAKAVCPGCGCRFVTVAGHR